MRFFPNTSIRRKQMLVILLTSVIVLILACAAFVTYDTLNFRRELAERVTVLTDVVGNNCAAAIDFNDAQAAGEMLNALQANPDIVSACVYSKAGQVIATYQRDPGTGFVPPPLQTSGQEFAGDELRLFRPISQKRELIGMIFVASDLNELTARLTRYMGIAGIVFLTSLLVALILSRWLQQLVSNPILQLARVARSVAQDRNYSLRAAKHGDDEIGQLVDGFNEMLAQIQQRDAAVQAARDELEARVVARTQELARANEALKAENAERQRAAEALEQEQKLLRLVIDHIPGPVYLKDLESRFLLANNAVAQIMGTPSPDGLLGKTDADFYPVDVAAAFRADEERVLAGARLVDQAAPVRLPDGRSRFLLHTKLPFCAPDGKVIGLVGTGHDITERQEAEVALRSSREEFKDLFDNAPVGFHEIDDQGRLIRINNTQLKMQGYSAGELLGQFIWNLSADEEATRQNVLAILRGEAPISQEFERRFRRKDGSTFPVRISARLLRREDGAITGFRSTVEDITEQKQAELALSESQALYHSLVDQMPAAVFRKDAEGRYVFVNESFCRVVGRPAEQMLGKTSSELLAGTQEAQAIVRLISDQSGTQGMEHHESIMRTGRQIVVEDEYLDSDGRRSFYRTVKSPVFDAGGKIIGSQGILFDITGRKLAELALQKERNLLRTLMDHIPDYIYVRDLSNRFVVANESFARLMGVASPSALIGKRDADFYPPGTAADFDKIDHEVFAGHPFFNRERVLRFPNGQELTTLNSKVPFKNDKGEVIGLLGVGRDITALKRAETELRWKSAFLEALLASSIDGILVVNDQGRKVFQNRRVVDLWKIPDEIANDPDDSKQVQCVMKRLKDPQQFVDGVQRQYGRPDEVSHDELEFADGTVLDRHSYPVTGQDGTRHGRIWQFRDITERKRAEAELNYERSLWRALLENSPDHIYFKDTQSRFIKASRSLAGLFGVKTPDEMLGRTDFDFFDEAHARPAFDDEREIIRTGRPMIGKEEQEVWKDGRVTWVSSTKIPLLDHAGTVIGIMGISRDITEHKRIEEHLIQSQKMETVGKLAGGVAHEFNSILTAIIGYCALLREDAPAGSPLAKHAAEISQAAERAATLTRQLLAYGRRQFLRPQALNLNQVITSMSGVLSHLMGGEMVEVTVLPAAGIKTVKADAGQIEQVIINLAMNARDAMPNGGKFTLETATVTLDQEYVSHYPDLKAGEYVMLAVTDTGRGMSDHVKSRAFEPFFTTKDVGQGSGLGLSTCYGIIKQSGGHINVYSERGRGTTFKIYLPQMEPAPASDAGAAGQPGPADLPRGAETILLVEDDPALREMAATLLRRLGYTVLAAADGIEALSLKQERGVGHLDLLFTDVVMPHMSGKELSGRIRALSPHTRILFTSAYTENAIVHQGVLDKGVALLSKPFTPAALAFKVREVLDHPSVPPSGTR
jgi:two-component system cell cycle sensor histidine kinase/response regulator CckA